jgi:type III restriction enzyme
MDVIPNPWQAARIMEEALASLEGRVTPERLYANRLYLLQEMRRELQARVDEAAEGLFRNKLAKGEITFRLMASNDEYLNWALAETLDIMATDADRVLQKQNGQALERLLFDSVYEKDVNGLERQVAWYLDGHAAVRWWHRLVAKQDYHLQGWQKNRIFPDFLVALTDQGNGIKRFAMLETKGNQLKGNDDTTYKTKLFSLLTEFYNRALDAGIVEIVDGNEQRMTFKMLLEEVWRPELSRLIAGAS